MLLYGEKYTSGITTYQKQRKRTEPLECRVVGKEIKLYLDFEKYIKWSLAISKDSFNANNAGYEWIKVEDQTGEAQIVEVNGEDNNPALKKFLKEREKMVIDDLLAEQLKGHHPLLSKDFRDRYIQLLETYKEELEKRDDIYVPKDELTDDDNKVEFPDVSLFI